MNQTSHPSQFISPVDSTLSALIILLILIAVPGNVSSFVFFSQRLNHNLHFLLYAVMSVTDICTCCFAVSPLVTLLNGRQNVAYTTVSSCVAWAIGAKFSVFFSMFVVLMISVTRTIAIVAPFYKIRRWAVIGALLGYGVGSLIFDSSFVALKLYNVRYSSTVAGCIIPVLHEAPNWIQNFYKYIMMLDLIIPSLTVLFSFLISTTYIVRKQKKRAPSKCGKKFKEASVTISIFTAVFLVCNLPFFVIHVLNSLPNRNNISLGVVKSYSWLISQGILPLINAAINPCVYFTRTSQFRRWVMFGLRGFRDNIVLMWTTSWNLILDRESRGTVTLCLYLYKVVNIRYITVYGIITRSLSAYTSRTFLDLQTPTNTLSVYMPSSR